MAIIKSDYPYIAEISGTFERKHKGDVAIVVRNVYGKNVASKVTYSDKDPSMAQLAQQERFAQAARLASQDMEDIDKKAEWQAIADASNGKYKTARGAAFAAYYTQNSQG